MRGPVHVAAVASQHERLVSEAKERAERLAASRPYLSSLSRKAGHNPILMWDVTTSEVIGHFFGHRQTVSALCTSADSQLLFSGSDDRTLRIWSVMDRACLWTLSGHPAQVSAIAISPPNSRALHVHHVYSAGGSEANDKLDAAERDNRIRKWAMPSHPSEDRGRFASRLRKPECLLDEAPFRGHDMWVRALCLTPDGGFLFSCSNDGTIIKFDARNGVALLTMRGHGEFDDAVPSSGLWSADAPPSAQATDPRFKWVRGLALAGEELFSVSNDWTLRSWHAGSGKPLFRYEAHENKVAGICLGNGCVFTGSNDGWVHQWVVRSDEAGRGSLRVRRTGTGTGTGTGACVGDADAAHGSALGGLVPAPAMERPRALPICSYSTQSAVACMAASAKELFTAIYDTQLMAWRALDVQAELDAARARKQAAAGGRRSRAGNDDDDNASNGRDGWAHGGSSRSCGGGSSRGDDDAGPYARLLDAVEAPASERGLPKVEAAPAEGRLDCEDGLMPSWSDGAHSSPPAAAKAASPAPAVSATLDHVDPPAHTLSGAPVPSPSVPAYSKVRRRMSVKDLHQLMVVGATANGAPAVEERRSAAQQPSRNSTRQSKRHSMQLGAAGRFHERLSCAAPRQSAARSHEPGNASGDESDGFSDDDTDDDDDDDVHVLKLTPTRHYGDIPLLAVSARWASHRRAAPSNVPLNRLIPPA